MNREKKEKYDKLDSGFGISYTTLNKNAGICHDEWLAIVQDNQLAQLRRIPSKDFVMKWLNINPNISN